MLNIKTIENFLSKEEIYSIVTFAKNVDQWENAGGNGFWDNRSLNAINIYNNYDKDLGEKLYNIREKIKKSIIKEYKLDVDVYPDLFQIVRWFPGQEQSPHADDMTNIDDDSLGWFKHRHFGSIIYLNDDYTGGHTYYPEHDIDIVPKSGMLAIHPGDPEHLHGVTRIENSIRYTIASFWTLDKEYFDGWTISQ
jgi:hypothetical protein